MASKDIPPIEKRGYAHPEALVSTDWVAGHLDDPSMRLVESNEDVLLRHRPHPGGRQDRLARRSQRSARPRLPRRGAVRGAHAREGISRDTTVVFYGDKNNWWATYALWVFKLFGHDDCRVMDGGRAKWEAEGRPMTTDVPKYPTGDYPVPERDDEPIRAFRDEVRSHMEDDGQLVDAEPAGVLGELLHMPEYPQEGAMRGGHIPGAKSVPWARAVDPDSHTFKSASDLRAIYCDEQGFTRRAHDRVPPDRRALEPHLVRSHVPTRLRRRAELRRVVDGEPVRAPIER